MGHHVFLLSSNSSKVAKIVHALKMSCNIFFIKILKHFLWKKWLTLKKPLMILNLICRFFNLDRPKHHNILFEIVRKLDFNFGLKKYYFFHWVTASYPAIHPPDFVKIKLNKTTVTDTLFDYGRACFKLIFARSVNSWRIFFFTIC
jgi:hypothetical protein